MHQPRTAFVSAVLFTSVAVSLTSCSATETHSTETQTTLADAAVPALSALPDPSQSQETGGKSYTVTTSQIDGSSPDGGGSWHAEVAQVAGGNPSVAEAFNSASKASAGRQIDQVLVDAESTPSWTFEVKPTLTFRPTALAQLLTGVYYAHGAAHPTNYVSTVVIDSRTAKPITLKDLFVTEQDGLDRLSEQTKLIWPKIYGDGGEPMPDEPGNRPIAENFANWIPTADGMELHFADYQFGHGLPVITVPWPALTDVLAPAMSVLARR